MNTEDPTPYRARRTYRRRANQKYFCTEKGRAALRRAQIKYRNSERGRAAQKAYRESPEGKAARKRAKAAYYQRNKARLQAERRDRYRRQKAAQGRG